MGCSAHVIRATRRPLLLAGAITLLLAPSAHAQQAHAPAHPSLVEAKTAYIHNLSDYADATDLLYEQLQRWGRYRVVGDPREADLVFVIEVTTRSTGSLTMPLGADTASGYAMVDPAGNIHFSARAYSSPRVSVPLSTTRAFVYVLARGSSGDLFMVWRDSEPVGFRKNKTAEKVVNRLRAIVPAYRPPPRERVAVPPTRRAADPDLIPVGAVPPAGSEIVAPVISDKSIRWTTRVAEQVGYAWGAVLDNRNAVGVTASVSIRLVDQQGSVIFDAVEEVWLQPNMATPVSGAGQVEEQVAEQGRSWSISVEASSAVSVSTSNGSLRSTAALGRSPARPGAPEATRAAAELVAASVGDFGVQLRRLIVRCRVRTDGTVQAAIVVQTVPELQGEALSEIIETIVNDWRFRPGMRGGNAVETWQYVTLPDDLRQR